MKKLVLISVFFATFLIGAMSPIDKPNIYERFYPGYSQNEINSLVGKKVVHQYNDYNFIKFHRRGILQGYRMMKYPLETERNSSETLNNGNIGKFISVEEVLVTKNPAWRNVLKNCPLLIKWDEKNADGKEMFSCAYRFADRISLKIED